jgi:anti-sigma regulatory factor (Ser/Thr protein kinase)
VAPAKHLPAEVRSASAARHFVRPFLYHCPPDFVDTAVLLTSELVTNALVHARSDVEVELTRHDGLIRIAVTDDTPDCPTIGPSVVLSEHGRGLPLVASQSQCWGVDETGLGKTVWFVLRLPS